MIHHIVRSRKMKISTPVHYTRHEWMRALGFSALSGVAAIALWFAVVLCTRGMSQALGVMIRQWVWLLPAVIAILCPVFLIAGRPKSASLDGGGCNAEPARDGTLPHV